MLYYTGLRPEEALALTKNDIDLIKSTISINKAITWEDSSCPVKIKGTKSEAGIRTIPFPGELKGILQEYIDNLTSLYIFPQPNGGMMQQKAYQRFFNKLRSKINLQLGGTSDKKVHGKIVQNGIKATDMTAYNLSP